MAALGISPHIYIKSRNDVERQLWVRIYELALAERETLDHNLGVAIAEEVAKVFSR